MTEDKLNESYELIGKMDMASTSIKLLSEGKNLINLSHLSTEDQVELRELLLLKFRKRYDELSKKFKEL